MPSFVMLPIGAGDTMTLTPVPAGVGTNWDRVNEYPTPDITDYVHTGIGGGAATDTYDKDALIVLPSITISDSLVIPHLASLHASGCNDL